MLFQLFDAGGRHLLYETLLLSCPYDGVVYLLLLWLKDEVLAADGVGMGEERRVFLGESLFHVVSLAMRLDRDTAEASITSRYDTHMAAINFLLFLLLRGPKNEGERVRQNPTGIWHPTLLDQVEAVFLTPLQRALQARLGALRKEAAQSSEAAPIRPNLGAGAQPAQRHETHAQRVLKLEVMYSALVRVQEVLAAGREALGE